MKKRGRLGMKKPLTLTAKYTRAADVTLRCGDCLKFLRQLPRASTQLVLTSPPYNVGKEYERRVGVEAYIEFQAEVIREAVRITKPGGSICWQVGHSRNGHGQMVPLDLLLHPVFAQFEDSHGLRLRNRIIWHFEHGLHCQKRFSGRYETILWYTVGDDYYFDLDAVRVPQKYPGKRAYKGPMQGQFSGNPMGKNPGDVWTIPNVKGNHIEKTEHPCQFPIALAETLVLALTRPRNLVVDPFMGVGTTAVAAAMHRRRVAGADTEIEYITRARRRVRDLEQGKLRYRPRQRPIYVPKPNTTLTTKPPGFGGKAR